MRNTILALAIALAASTAVADDVRIEPDAVIGSTIQEMSNMQEYLNALATMIRSKRWRCDSISAASMCTFSRCVEVTCNNWAYDYEIADKGGNLIVTLED